MRVSVNETLKQGLQKSCVLAETVLLWNGISLNNLDFKCGCVEQLDFNNDAIFSFAVLQLSMENCLCIS